MFKVILNMCSTNDQNKIMLNKTINDLRSAESGNELSKNVTNSHNNKYKHITNTITPKSNMLNIDICNSVINLNYCYQIPKII